MRIEGLAKELAYSRMFEVDAVDALDAVTNEKFEVQRATVKNEKGQNYLNRPYGLWNEKTMEALYPYGHPYSWLTIGLLKDLDSANLDDLKNFFLHLFILT